MTADGLGAYGMRLPGLPGGRWLVPAPPKWPIWYWAHESRPATPAEALSSLEADRVCIPFEPGTSMLIERNNRRFAYVAEQAPRDVGWVHPLLSPVAMFAAEWSGRLVFHAGSFLDSAGRVWALLGHREHGKSTTLAWLAANGYAVFADDLLVTDGTVAYAGPRCIDLRESAAAVFGIGEPLGDLGSRARWRVDLPGVPPEASLGGFIALEWSGSTDDAWTMVGNDGAARAARLKEARALLVAQEHPMAWLGLLSLPMLTFVRPRSWQSQDQVLNALIHAVNQL